MAKKVTEYENNPFYIGLSGLQALFTRARGVAVFAIVVSVLALILNVVSTIADSPDSLTMTEAQLAARDRADQQAVREFFAQDPGQLAVFGVLFASAVFLFVVIWMWLYGTLEYTGARLAAGEKVGLKEALRETGKDLASYIWLYVIMGVKIFLWSLLLIVPGIIMAVRYSLAGTAFFAEGKRGNAAIKRSLELTKGAWFTTFAGYGLWNFITFGMITPLLQPGVNAVLYRNFRYVTDEGLTKPAAHWLSWLAFFVPIAMLMLFIGLAVVLALILATSFGP